MSDLISRKAAIDAILHITNCKSVRELFEYNQEHHLTEMWSGGVNDAIDAVIGVESAIDNNVGTKLSTNLASLGTDCSEFPNNSDAISRQAAIDDIWTVSPLARLDRKWIDRWLRQLPPIQPKRGRWVYCEDSMADCVDGYRCDQCGFFVPWDYQHKSIDYIKDYNFCPNCGADMRGEQDG